MFPGWKTIACQKSPCMVNVPLTRETSAHEETGQRPHREFLYKLPYELKQLGNTCGRSCWVEANHQQSGAILRAGSPQRRSGKKEEEKGKKTTAGNSASQCLSTNAEIVVGYEVSSLDFTAISEHAKRQILFFYVYS